MSDRSSNNACTVVLGGQWGDEGKGKLVDLLAVDAEIVCRCQVNNNYDYRTSQVSTRQKRLSRQLELHETVGRD